MVTAGMIVAGEFPLEKVTFLEFDEVEGETTSGDTCGLGYSL